MGYMHIDNLYKDQSILRFRECFALEKIHGTSAHVAWKDGELTFFAGGEKHTTFLACFDEAALRAAFEAMGHSAVTVYGEAYGGKQQGQSWRYGDKHRFVAFDVKVGDTWLTVPHAADVASKLGLEFVHWVKVSTELAALDAERDAPSEQSRRNGVDGDKPREGVVLRPLFECSDNRGGRIISKHKRDDERETSKPRKVVDPAKWEVLSKAQAIADEWVTPMRLAHVLDKLGPVTVEQTREVITAMIEDVVREAAGEIVDSQAARTAIARKTAEMFKTRQRSALEESAA